MAITSRIQAMLGLFSSPPPPASSRKALAITTTKSGEVGQKRKILFRCKFGDCVWIAHFLALALFACSSPVELFDKREILPDLTGKQRNDKEANCTDIIITT